MKKELKIVKSEPIQKSHQERKNSKVISLAEHRKKKQSRTAYIPDECA